MTEVLADMGLHEKPIVTALNKIDQAVSTDVEVEHGPPDEADLRQTLRDLTSVYPHGVAVSAVKGWGLDRLLVEMATVLEERWVNVSVDIPYGEDKMVALFHERGNVEEEAFRPEGTHMRGKLPKQLAERFRRFASDARTRHAGLSR